MQNNDADHTAQAWPKIVYSFCGVRIQFFWEVFESIFANFDNERFECK